MHVKIRFQISNLGPQAKRIQLISRSEHVSFREAIASEVPEQPSHQRLVPTSIIATRYCTHAFLCLTLLCITHTPTLFLILAQQHILELGAADRLVVALLGLVEVDHVPDGVEVLRWRIGISTYEHTSVGIAWYLRRP